MPDRIIRDQCRRSPTLQRLSDAAERGWWRLTVYHDDYGRFEADAEVLLAGLMARRPAGWTRAKMQRVVEEWADARDPLIHLYQVPGDLRIYGHTLTTNKHQRERESKPKYPDPPCGNLPQDAAKCRESLQIESCGKLPQDAARARALGSRESGVGSKVSYAPVRDPRVRLVIAFYHQVFLERFGAPPTINGGKCGAVAKRLLTGRSIEDVQWLIREHLERPPDLYERKRLYGLEHVLSAANTLLARRAERRP